jgi:hypothetical protein
MESAAARFAPHGEAISIVRMDRAPAPEWLISSRTSGLRLFGRHHIPSQLRASRRARRRAQTHAAQRAGRQPRRFAHNAAARPRHRRLNLPSQRRCSCGYSEHAPSLETGLGWSCSRVPCGFPSSEYAERAEADKVSFSLTSVRLHHLQQGTAQSLGLPELPRSDSCGTEASSNQ